LEILIPARTAEIELIKIGIAMRKTNIAKLEAEITQQEKELVEYEKINTDCLQEQTELKAALANAKNLARLVLETL
jgi:hypothetical protein